jgi:uncharacterized protein YcbK (DUF882 family)
MGDLSEHFSKYEFACKCGCGYGTNIGDVSQDLLELLEDIREEVGGPVRINSGCRCDEWNDEQGGSEYSRHMTGEAADIRVQGGWHRYNVQRAAHMFGAEGVGTAKGFIHVDVSKGDEDCPRPSAWVY